MATAGSDDELAYADEPSLPKTTVLAVQQWINTPTHIVESQEWALELYTLAPLMFGRSIPRSPAPSAEVFRRLLSMDSRVPTKDLDFLVQRATAPSVQPDGYLTDEEIERIDFWRVVCKRTLHFLATMSPDQLAAHVSLWQPSGTDTMKTDYCSMLVNQFIQLYPSGFADDTCAAISTFHHFAVLIQRVSVSERFHDLFSEHSALREYLVADEKIVSEIHEKGNSAFKDGKYSLAKAFYSEAICRFPFSSVLYGNRAQVNLRQKDARHAVSDGLRCVSLDPTYIKGMWRFAEALFEIGNDSLAFVYNHKARRACSSEDSGFIKEQLEKFRRTLPADLPKLVDTENDSDDDEDKEIKLKSLANKQSISQTVKHKAKTEPQQRKNSSDASRSPQDGGGDTQSFHVTSMQNGNQQQHSARADGADVAFTAAGDGWAARLLSELVDGGAALSRKSYKPAKLHYDVCISLLSSHATPSPIVDRISNQPISLPLLRYSCGMACLELATLPDINTGMDYFNDIIASNDEVTCPLAYFGLGRAHMQLGRYHLALDHLRKGQHLVSTESKVPSSLKWPGTTIVIPESCQIKACFEDAVMQCRYPPKPDAICVFDECLSHDNVQREIYTFSSCFEGLVNLTCTRRCRIQYHNKCWQHVKSKIWDKSTHKDSHAGGPCITPYCTGRLSRLKTVARRGGEDIVKEISFSVEKYNGIKPKRPLLKTPPQSDRAIERKAQRKLQRKARHVRASDSDVSATGQPVPNAGNADTPSDQTSGSSGRPLALTDTERIRMTHEEPVTVIKKEKEEDIISKDSVKCKNQKKKLKSKTIRLDEFIGRSNCDDETDSASIESGGRMLYSSDGYRLASSSGVWQSRPPRNDSILMHAEDLSSSASPDLQQSLVSFFEDLLQEHATLHVEDVAITRYLVDCFPPEALSIVSDAGGIGSFLSQYPQFDLVGDYVMLRSSARLFPAAGVMAESQPRMITPRMLQQPAVPKLAAPHLLPSALPLAAPQTLVKDWVNASSVPRLHGNGLLPTPAAAYSMYGYDLYPLLQPLVAVPPAIDLCLPYLSMTADRLPAPSVRSSSSYFSGSNTGRASSGNAGAVVSEEAGSVDSDGHRSAAASPDYFSADNRASNLTSQGVPIATTTLSSSSVAGSAGSFSLAFPLASAAASRRSGCEVGLRARMLDSFNYPLEHRSHVAVDSAAVSVAAGEDQADGSDQKVSTMGAADDGADLDACAGTELLLSGITNATSGTKAGSGPTVSPIPIDHCVERHSVSDVQPSPLSWLSSAVANSQPYIVDTTVASVAELSLDVDAISRTVVPCENHFASDLAACMEATRNQHDKRQPVGSAEVFSRSSDGSQTDPTASPALSSLNSTRPCGRVAVADRLPDRLLRQPRMVDASVQVEREPRSVLLPRMERGVQVDGLREECELLKVALKAEKEKLLHIRKDKALFEISASRDRESLTKDLQARKQDMEQLSRDLSAMRDKLDAVRQALGEHSRDSAVDVLDVVSIADDVTRLRTLLNDEIARRLTAESASVKHAETVQRLQTDLVRVGADLAESESKWEQQCLRARQAEAALVELKYERAAAPLCALLRYTKLSLELGNRSPSTANALVVLLHRLSRAIVELKAHYDRQLMMVTAGRLLSSLPDMNHANLLSSMEELHVLADIAPVQAFLHPPQVPRLSSVPPRSTDDSASSLAGQVPPDSASVQLPVSGHNRTRMTPPNLLQQSQLLLLETRAAQERDASAAGTAAAAGNQPRDDGAALNRQSSAFTERSRDELAGPLIRTSAARDSTSGRNSPSSLTYGAIGDGSGRASRSNGDGSLLAGQYRRGNVNAVEGATAAGSAPWSVPLPSSNSRRATGLLLPQAAFSDSLALQDGSDPCCICHEQMHADDVTSLSCRHYYHTSCIKDWFEVQKTCPLCRTFDLIPEDYPDLI